MTRFFISTIPFASTNTDPLKLLVKKEIDYEINSFGRKITENELANQIQDFEVLIAGTEPITKKVIDKAKKLKVISRVGVGIDNIDLEYAKSKGIIIKKSLNGPSVAVAEYTLGLILNALRHIHIASSQTKDGIWKKTMGRDLRACSVGVLGAGNIGTEVIRMLSGFSPKRIYFHDPYFNGEIENATKLSMDEIISKSDILTFHLPLTDETINLITIDEFKRMKKDSLIINTSRGGIINEEDLYTALKSKLISGAALDVFNEEPYLGQLNDFENCLISPHMAPMSVQARESMELDAIKQALEVLAL